MSQLFVVRKLFSSNTVYISSTVDLNKRIYSHIELEPTFDITSHLVFVFTITDSKYNAYQIDKIIQRMSNSYDAPYSKCSGLNNHYYYNNIYSLSNFLDAINVKYVQQQVNTHDLHDTCRSYSPIECQEFILDEMKQFKNVTVNEKDYNEVEDLYIKDNDLGDSDDLLLV